MAAFDHQRGFHSLLLFPGFDLRLHRDEKEICPLQSLALLTAEHTTEPLGDAGNVRGSLHKLLAVIQGALRQA